MGETNGLAVVDQGPVGLPTVTFTREQIDLIKETVAKDTTDNELALFLYTAKRTGLDPLVRQIHAVKRSGKMAIQVGIDGFRLVADRTRNHAGTDDPVYETGKDGNPVKATVTVYKIVGGQRCPFSATARWTEYFPGEAQGFMWKKMPFLMLGKCAEALALRKAFPAELSGVYSPEEMAQADGAPMPQPKANESHEPEAAPENRPARSSSGGTKISDKQGKRLYAIWKAAGKSDDEVKSYIKAKYGLTSTRDILVSDYEAIVAWVQSKKSADTQDEHDAETDAQEEYGA